MTNDRLFLFNNIYASVNYVRQKVPLQNDLFGILSVSESADGKQLAPSTEIIGPLPPSVNRP